MTRPFVLGINYPWVTCGHDFGARPPAWGGPVRRDFEAVRRELSELRALGLTVIRHWLLAGGVNYPVGANLDTVGRLVPTGDGWLHAVASLGGQGAVDAARRWRASGGYETVELLPGARPPPLPAEFLEDYRALLAACRAADVQLVPSLVSFELFQPAVRMPGGVIKRGRKALVFGNAGGTDGIAAFLDAVLEPLLEASRDFAESVYAFEVINEPEWVVMERGQAQMDPSSYGYVPSMRWVTGAEMSAFIDQAVDRICRHGFVATVGFEDDDPPWLAPQVRQTLRERARAGAYVHQRHHYPTVVSDRVVPPHQSLAIRPCLLGELPTRAASGPENIRWRDPELATTERDPHRYLEARLELIRARGYAGALLWSARSEDRRRAWDVEQQRQVARFSSRFEKKKRARD